MPMLMKHKQKPPWLTQEAQKETLCATFVKNVVDQHKKHWSMLPQKKKANSASRLNSL